MFPAINASRYLFFWEGVLFIKVFLLRLKLLIAATKIVRGSKNIKGFSGQEIISKVERKNVIKYPPTKAPKKDTTNFQCLKVYIPHKAMINRMCTNTFKNAMFENPKAKKL